jgi:hypothetical protein
MDLSNPIEKFGEYGMHLFDGKKMPRSFWYFALQHAVRMMNHRYTGVNRSKRFGDPSDG